MFAQLARPFTLTSINDRGAGRYLQFDPWESVALNIATRETELDDIRWHLFFQLIAEIAGSQRPHVMARSWCGPVDSFPAVKQRIARIRRHPGSFDASARRKNGIVAMSKRRFGDWNVIFDELVDAPVWQLSKRRSWEWADLADYSTSIELMGFSIDDRRFQRPLNAEEFTGPKERRRCRFGRSSQWAWLNAEFFRLARAEAVGDVDDYGFTYNQIQFHLALGRLFSLLQYPGEDHVETGFFGLFPS